ncbi:hypothetical protein DPMN_094705 [Dreissena polymorpha]|uniref:tRNA-queuosine alpha-mannosyltransferase n=1 Tax=Dreissena polymorpha TaxID=45954 RepID=A0A9D4L6I5_DREPO|nr:hypothetical protein DPMN_094705 [Dreissena polymorpha]
MASCKNTILLLEPFYTGSHRQLMDLLHADVPGSSLVTMTGKKWHWRARTGALYLSMTIPRSHCFRTLFASSVLNLAELIALRPDLSPLKKVLYFHENQLTYPVQAHKQRPERDFQYGYNQIMSCVVANQVLFNSEFNKTSFLANIKSFFKLMPDHHPSGVADQISPKCHVLNYPIVFPETVPEVNNVGSATGDVTSNMLCASQNKEDCVKHAHISGTKRLKKDDSPLHIVWPHRWEHDKNPESFFQAMVQLQAAGCDFQLSVIGDQYSEVPAIFEEASSQLKDKIRYWGFQKTRGEYFRVLHEADVVVSTANHEFFGVAMLEAVHCGCYPLVPNRLVYPEIFPDENIYNTDNQLFKRLRDFCKNPSMLRRKEIKIDTHRYSWASHRAQFLEILEPPTIPSATANTSRNGHLA